MTAPLILSNQLIVTPSLVGPLPQYQALNLVQGASYAASWAWIDNGAGVDPSTATSVVATLRQIPTDTPLVTVTGAATANGQITYLTPVPNFPYLPPSLDDVGTTPVLITIYPFQVAITVAGVALVNVPYCQWQLTFTWSDGTATSLLSGEVFASAV